MLEHKTFLVPTLLAPVAVVEIGESSGKMPDYGIRKAKEAIEIHRDSIAKAYAAKHGRTPEMIHLQAADGAEIWKS